ncbi:hypothetical protein MKW92_006126 [Papaver armeniacum]|nr:hypothetical protein MKW92_006126 [Papaver armeniacum]
MEKPAAERKCHFFNIFHDEEEEEEQSRRLRKGPGSSSREPLDAKKLRRMAQSRESSRTFRLRKKLQTSKIAELAAEEEQNRRLRIPCENSAIKRKGSSSQEKFAAAAGVPREVRSFSSPFPFFWTSMNPTSVGARFRMTIPLQFARDHLLADVTNADRELNVLLQNEEGLSWEVLVEPNGHSYTFCTGWKDFATDNKLEIGDCVIFELIDRLPDSTFAMSFHIFRIPVPVPSLVPAQKSNGPGKESFTHLPSSPLAREIKRRGRAYESSTIREGGSDNHEELASAIAVQSKVKSFSSPFPFFWISVKPSNVHRTNIPVTFAREHLPTNMKSGEEKMDVLLKNEEGCSWELHLCSRGFAKYYFSKGWKTFALENNLSIGDYVLFELIDRHPGGTLVMNFHIYQSPVLVEDDLDDE